METVTTEPGNRIRTTCSCGNEFTVPPSKHGQYVHCLECNEETLALAPEERQRMEKRRRPAWERHVQAIALWLAACGLLLCMSGVTFLVEKTAPELLPSPGLGVVPGGLLVVLLGAGLIYLATQVQVHRTWARPVLRFGSPVVLALLITGLYFGTVPWHPVYAGVLVLGVLVLYVANAESGREMFSEDYRHILTIFRKSMFGGFRSYVFWVPLLVMIGSALALLLVA